MYTNKEEKMCLRKHKYEHIEKILVVCDLNTLKVKVHVYSSFKWASWSVCNIGRKITLISIFNPQGRLKMLNSNLTC